MEKQYYIRRGDSLRAIDLEEAGDMARVLAFYAMRTGALFKTALAQSQPATVINLAGFLFAERQYGGGGLNPGKINDIFTRVPPFDYELVDDDQINPLELSPIVYEIKENQGATRRVTLMEMRERLFAACLAAETIEGGKGNTHAHKKRIKFIREHLRNSSDWSCNIGKVKAILAACGAGFLQVKRIDYTRYN